jgi:hypothetical protein
VKHPVYTGQPTTTHDRALKLSAVLQCNFTAGNQLQLLHDHHCVIVSSLSAAAAITTATWYKPNQAYSLFLLLDCHCESCLACTLKPSRLALSYRRRTKEDQIYYNKVYFNISYLRAH